MDEKQKKELHELLFQLDWDEGYDESIIVEKKIIKFIDGVRSEKC